MANTFSAALNPGSPHQASMRRSQRELAAHGRRLDELSDMWASGELSRDEWLSLKRKVKGRTDAAEAEVDRLDRIGALAAMAGRGGALRSRWPAMDADDE